jgi:hypothetical protein
VVGFIGLQMKILLKNNLNSKISQGVKVRFGDEYCISTFLFEPGPEYYGADHVLFRTHD